MRRGVRLGIALAALVVLFGAMVWGAGQLPRYGETRGPQEHQWHDRAVHVRQVTNLDAFVNFDLRAFDTLGEELLLFTAVSGLALLLRDRYGPVTDEPFRPDLRRRFYWRSELVRWLGVPLLGLGAVFGIVTIVHGQLTPGGGFQGGVLTASMLALAYFAQSYDAWDAVGAKERNDVFEALGAASYGVVGVAALAMGASFLANVLPLGTVRDVLSGGTIWVINAAVGVEVTFAFLIVFAEYLKQTRRVKDEDGR